MSENLHHIVKAANAVLNQWADLYRAGFRKDLGAKISSVYRIATPNKKRITLDDDLIDEIDTIVCNMQYELQQSTIRYYLDPVFGKQYVYYKKNGRTMEMKAKTEKISAEQLKINIRIVKHIVYHQLAAKDLI